MFGSFVLSCPGRERCYWVSRVKKPYPGILQQAVFFGFFLALELLCSDCSILAPLFFFCPERQQQKGRGQRPFRLCWRRWLWLQRRLLRPTALVSCCHQQSACRNSNWCRSMLLSDAAFGWTDPICAHNPDWWPDNQWTQTGIVTVNQFVIGTEFA